MAGLIVERKDEGRRKKREERRRRGSVHRDTERKKKILPSLGLLALPPCSGKGVEERSR